MPRVRLGINPNLIHPAFSFLHFLSPIFIFQPACVGSSLNLFYTFFCGFLGYREKYF